MTDVIYRCPSCKARVELSDTACGLCGQALTPTTLLHSPGAASGPHVSAAPPLLRPTPVSALEAKAATQSGPEVAPGILAPGVVVLEPALAQAETRSMATPREPAIPPSESRHIVERPLPISAQVESRAEASTETFAEASFVQPPIFVPATRTAKAASASNLTSRYSVPLMLGGAVVVLTAALVLGVNLARQTTTDVGAVASGALSSMSATPASVATAEVALAGLMDAPQSTVVAQSTEVASARATLEVGATAMAQANSLSLTTAAATPQVEAAVSATVVAQPLNKWQLELASAHYETAGRPAQSCSAFNADQPIRKFTFTLRVTNNTGIDLDARRWGAAAYVGAAPAEQLCYFKTEGPTLPTLLHGQTQQVTLAAFVEPGQDISQIVIGDNEGNAAYLCLHDTEVVECKITP